jgi:anti-sigma factor ChrR (cupin superfamily)
MFRYDLSRLLSFSLDEAALAALAWKTLPTGVAMARLHREGETGLVLYHIPATASPEAFAAHRHPGGEVYLVLRGVIDDEQGSYHAGELVYLPLGSSHTPSAKEDTIVLVLWPNGVAAV